MDAIALCIKSQTEMFGDARLELIDALTTPDVIDHGAATPNGTHGREALKGTIQWIHSGFDDVAYDVNDAFQSDDKVVIRCTVRGTNTREWMASSPPASRSQSSTSTSTASKAAGSPNTGAPETTSACCASSVTSDSEPRSASGAGEENPT